MTGLVQNPALVCNPSKCVEKPAPEVLRSIEDMLIGSAFSTNCNAFAASRRPFSEMSVYTSFYHRSDQHTFLGRVKPNPPPELRAASNQCEVRAP
jgi:hypothetical protein